MSERELKVGDKIVLTSDVDLLHSWNLSRGCAGLETTVERYDGHLLNFIHNNVELGITKKLIDWDATDALTGNTEPRVMYSRSGISHAWLFNIVGETGWRYVIHNDACKFTYAIFYTPTKRVHLFGCKTDMLKEFSKANDYAGISEHDAEILVGYKQHEEETPQWVGYECKTERYRDYIAEIEKRGYSHESGVIPDVDIFYVYCNNRVGRYIISDYKADSDMIWKTIELEPSYEETLDKQMVEAISKTTEKEPKMATKKVSLAKVKETQVSAAKIAAKIELGKVANTQITARIMKEIKLPAFLVGYKKQLEPVVKLLVANGGIVAADSLGVNNDKAEFILEAMQLAGTQEVLGLINLDETVDNLIGLIDPKLMAKAGYEEGEE